MQGHVSVTFCVECDKTRPGEAVFAVGSHAELGQWDPLEALPLSTTAEAFPVWSSRPIRVPARVDLEYKFIMQQEVGSGYVLWEELAGNRRVRAAESSFPHLADAASAVTTAMSVWGVPGEGTLMAYESRRRSEESEGEVAYYQERLQQAVEGEQEARDGARRERALREEAQARAEKLLRRAETGEKQEVTLEETLSYCQDLLRQAVESERQACEKARQEQALKEEAWACAQKLEVAISQHQERLEHAVAREQQVREKLLQEETLKDQAQALAIGLLKRAEAAEDRARMLEETLRGYEEMPKQANDNEQLACEKAQHEANHRPSVAALVQSFDHIKFV